MNENRFVTPDLKHKNKFKQDEGYRLKSPIFSFKYFHENQNKNKYYKRNHRDKNDLYNFMLGLQKIAAFTWGEIIGSHQFHGHDINDFEFSNENIKNEQPMQFTAPGLDIARIIGFIDNEQVFQIVKFDKKHQIYPGR